VNDSEEAKETVRCLVPLCVCVHTYKLYNLYSSPNIIRVIESRRVSEIAASNRTHGKAKHVSRILVAEPKEREYLEDLSLNRRKC
jgi:stage III sporulation protein SpoIIIAA